MGAGSAYSYPHFMLFDESIHTIENDYFITFSIVPPLSEETRKEICDQCGARWDDDQFATMSSDEAKKVKERLESLGADEVEIDEPTPEFDDEAWEMFKEDICNKLDATCMSTPKHLANDVYIFGEHEHFEVGCDRSGGSPCIFVRPLTYEDGDDEVTYQIDNRVKAGFNKLLAEYVKGTFSYPTSAWTSMVLTEYPL